MAYNPFHVFRKHQKVIFAVLTILCMVTFVLASNMGRGDFFQKVVEAFSGHRSGAVASLYGHDVTDQDLALLREQRRLANQYMYLASSSAHSKVVEDLAKQLREPQQDPKDPKAGGFEPFQQQILESVLGQFGMLQRGDFQSLMALEQLRQAPGQLNMLRQQLLAANKNDQARTVDKLRTVVSNTLDLNDSARGGNYYLYFGGGDSRQDLLDFKIWLHQADKLGIQLTPDAVKKAIADDLPDRLDNARRAEIERQVLGRNRPELLLPALADEFRVRLAKSVMLGTAGSGASLAPSLVTPAGFWQYFQDNRTSVNVALLPVNAKAFLDQVQETPADATLRELFEKHKNTEYRPDLATPGFKQPRRIEVQWVSGRHDAPAYKQLAGAATALLQATLPGVYESQLLKEYDAVKYTRYRVVSPFDGWTGFEFPLQDRSLAHPAVAAATAAQAAASAGSLGTPWAALSSHRLAATAREAQARTALAAGLAGFAATEAPALTAYTQVLAVTPTEQYRPLAEIRNEVREKLVENAARDLLIDNLNALRRELESLRWKPAEAKTYVAEAVKRYALQTGSTVKPRDVFDLADDPGLKPIRDLFLKDALGVMNTSRRLRQLPMTFFTPVSNYTPQLFSNFGPEEMAWRISDEPIVFWKTSDKQAHVPAFEDVKDQVVYAWKLDKARALAQKEAERIADKARQARGDADKTLRDASTGKGAGEVFTLNNVVRLRQNQAALISRAGTTYTPFRVPDDKEEKLEYLIDPRFGTFADAAMEQILALKTPGEVTVLADRPKTTYYVTALTSRIDPAPGEFNMTYRQTAGFMPDGLFQQHYTVEQQVDFRQAVLGQLRADARVTIKEPERTRDGRPVEFLEE